MKPFWWNHDRVFFRPVKSILLFSQTTNRWFEAVLNNERIQKNSHFQKIWEKISYLFIEIWCHLKITDDLSAGFWTENLGNNWFAILLDSSCIDLLMIRKNSCRDFSQCINSQLRIHFYQIGCITFIAELRFSRIEIVLKLFCFFGFNMTQ